MVDATGTELSPELIEWMQKVGGRETGRLAFERFFGTALRLSDDFSKAELEVARQKFLAALKD